jgi:hypothetical protein
LGSSDFASSRFFLVILSFAAPAIFATRRLVKNKLLRKLYREFPS